jgi:uncharacterized protein (DUF736 family)
MERQDNTGNIFPNDRKERDEQPDYTGKLKVEGKEYYISGWKRANQQSSYISFKLRLVEPDSII